MNLQAYITSGILELYVFGLASAEEAREVEELAEKHPEVRQEIEALRLAMERYALSHSVKPPEDLKGKILGRLDHAPRTKPKTTVNPEIEHRPTTQHEPLKISATSILAFLLAIGLIGACVAAWHFFNQSKTAETQALEAQSQLEQLRKDCETRQQAQALLEEKLNDLRHWATRPIQMRGTKIAENAFAVVYWNANRKKSYLNVVNLPEPPQDKQYQLWAIVDGKPTDMGVFEVKKDSSDLQPVPFIAEPQAFAVTLEPKGGSPAPTLDQMYVIGKVGK
jgi:anti-sigma-K factor RskA